MKEALVSSKIYVLKCTLAAVSSILLANLMGLEDTLSASFVAIICIKPTFYTGLITGKQQFIASFWGGAITGALILLLGKGIAVTAISLLLVISLCVYKKWTNYVAVSAFTVLYMFLIPHETVEGVLVRMASVFLGVATASTVNLIMSFIRYKDFFNYRIKYASQIVHAKFIQTIYANQKADLASLELLYYDYENLYAQLTGFGNEISDTIKELKIRKRAGGISAPDLETLYRVIESLKMSIRYLQDIVYLSKSLVPRHQEIPIEWKKKIDSFWEIEKNRFEIIMNKIASKEFDENEILERNETDVVNEIAHQIKINLDKKDIYMDVMGIIIDFQQLHLTITNLNYFVNQYNSENNKSFNT